MRTALRPEGPWTDREPIFQIPEWNPKIWCYASKSHPELVPPSEQQSGASIIFSYNCNYNGTPEEFQDTITPIYVPQFVHTKIAWNKLVKKVALIPPPSPSTEAVDKQQKPKSEMDNGKKNRLRGG